MITEIAACGEANLPDRFAASGKKNIFSVSSVLCG
jgi:hypothetical protein